jgi:uncharacterized protein (DUF305 family)
MNKKLLSLSATAFAAALALAGCATGSGSPGTSMPMDHGRSSASATAPTAQHNAADVTFAQMMIPHHAQAVQMSQTMLEKQGIPADVTALAIKIKAAQGPEIDLMTGWLKSWNEPVSMPSGHTSQGMNGMMGDEDIV